VKRKITGIALAIGLAFVLLSFNSGQERTAYETYYFDEIAAFEAAQQQLLQIAETTDLEDTASVAELRAEIQSCRNVMKGIDIWLRYLDPVSYKSINGPLPVEWETEVFEKFEKPYRRDGAGLTLAALYLDEEAPQKEELVRLIKTSIQGMGSYRADSTAGPLKTFDHFYLCNRLFLLNLAAIYTTGFECPDASQIVPELRLMMQKVQDIYKAYNLSFPEKPLPEAYLTLYRQALGFVAHQPDDYTRFPHFEFIRDYVNLLFALNQQYIREYQVFSRSMVDYSMTKTATTIFSKSLYNGQNAKGIFLRVKDSSDLAAIERVGKLLFFDPILSGNNNRSCASCHKPAQCFTDTSCRSNLMFNQAQTLPRNTPSLVNAGYNHLLMLDGKHISLQNQAGDVIANKNEMGCDPGDALRKVLSCKEYKEVFTRLLKYTPQEPQVMMEHITAAITYYYSRFSQAASPFDDAMNGQSALASNERQGFNLFMSKAQCGTCHFVPQFNGVKPPYVGSEFEVLGVPTDTAFTKLSPDQGRFVVFPADETKSAFRTGTLRNAALTAPYMHNGVFRDLEQVVEFYNNGGGTGRGLSVPNQTLSGDSLRLTAVEKQQLIAFIRTLNEHVPVEKVPIRLPQSSIKALNSRRVGGIY